MKIAKKRSLKGLKPIIGHDTKVLILGSFPGQISLSKKQYYANKANQFWGIILDPAAGSIKYRERIKLLQKKHIGLWDVIASCRRKGSLDSQIKCPKYNDIAGLLRKYPQVKAIFLNGSKAKTLFFKAFPESLKGILIRALPSTSPANARYSARDKQRLWHQVIARDRGI